MNALLGAGQTASAGGARRPFFEGMRPPPGRDDVPPFVAGEGWLMESTDVVPFLSYLDSQDNVSWSSELEELHDEQDHFIDSLTRQLSVGALSSSQLGQQPVLVDLGCSGGRLLRDLQVAWPEGQIVGVDAVRDGLVTAHRRVPEAALLHASVTDLPLGDGTVDAFAALNLLEHLLDDMLALREMQRVLRAGGRAVVVVPSNPSLYDHYDSFLKHRRRYARGDLAVAAQRVGLRVVSNFYIGSLIYPGFWAVKKFGRWRHRSLSDERSRDLVRRKIRATQASRLGKVACDVERRVLARGIRLPFGVRELLVLERP